MNTLRTSGEMTCSACPTQYEGTFNGLYWYFRARHGCWSFGIADTEDDAVCEPKWSTFGEDSTMGWMKPADACAIILHSLAAYIEDAAKEKGLP